MSDIIDIDTGAIICGDVTIEDAGSSMLDTMLDIASGKTLSKAELLGQNDFIPWKRGISL
jgi:altronate hydrolase